ncbi:MAG: hypothetical protein FWG30_01095 [Eubacteriaceae bacterium]|nr:hypothetical protein [Eubacteriaceae bacterium]
MGIKKEVFAHCKDNEGMAYALAVDAEVKAKISVAVHKSADASWTATDIRTGYGLKKMRTKVELEAWLRMDGSLAAIKRIREGEGYMKAANSFLDTIERSYGEDAASRHWQLVDSCGEI